MNARETRRGRPSGRPWADLKVRPYMAGVLALILLAGSAFAGQIKVTYVQTEGSYGNCTYVEFPNGRNMLMDGGGSSAATNLLTAFLDAKIGAGGTIWYMVLSHPHTDHFNGLLSALARYQVMYVYDGQFDPGNGYATFNTNANAEPGAVRYLPAPTATTDDVVSGTGLNLGPGWDADVTAKILHCNNSTADPNDRSIFLKITYGQTVFSIGGDAVGGTAGAAGTGTENWLVTNKASQLTGIDFYTGHHHGGNNSSSNAILDQILPKFCGICTGFPSATGNIRQAMLDRLTARNVKIYRTDLDADFKVVADDADNYNIIRQYVYPAGGTTAHDGAAAPPSLPSGLAIAGRTASSIDLTWTANPPADNVIGYDVYRATLSGGLPGNTSTQPGMSEATGIYTKVNGVLVVGTAYTDTGLATGATYFYRAVAVNNRYYERRYSNEVSTVTTGAGDTTAPIAVSNLSAASGTSSGDITLTWSAPSEDGGSGGASSSYILKYATFGLTGLTTTQWWNGGPSAAPTAYVQSWTPSSPGTLESKSINLATNNTYYFGLEGVDDAGNTATLSNVPSLFVPADGTNPNAITDLVASSAAVIGTVTITWTAPGNDGTTGNVSSYVLKYATFGLTGLTTAQWWNGGPSAAPTTYVQSWTPAATRTSETRTLQNLASGATYYFGMKGQDGAGNQGALPDPPGNSARAGRRGTNVVIAEVSADGPNGAQDEYVLLYNPTSASVDISGWILEYSAATPLSWTTKATVPASVSVASGTYYLAVNSNASNGYSKPLSGPTSDLAWSDTGGIVVAGGHMRLMNGVTEVDKVGWGTATAPEGGVATAIAASGAIARGDGYARDNNDNQPDFAQADRDPKSKVAPARPDALAANGSLGKISLNWTAVTGVDGYWVYRSTLSGSGFARRNAAVVTNPTYDDTVVQNGITYFYYATSSSTANGSESGYSNQASGVPSGSPDDTTPPAAITNLSALAGGGRQINLTWTAPPEDGAGSSGKSYAYVVRYSTAAIDTDAKFDTVPDYGQAWTPAAPGVTESYTVSGLSGGTTYYIAIEARDETGNQASLSNGTIWAPAGPLGTAATDHVLISEVWGWESATTEWVELYNPTESAVTITGWKIITNTTSNTLPTATIQPRSFYKSGDAGLTNPVNDNDATITITNSDSFVRLENGSAVVIDAVGWGTGGTGLSAGTTPYASNPASGARGLSRLPGSPNGNGTETNDCRETPTGDFTLLTSSSGRNTTSAAEPATSPGVNDLVAPNAVSNLAASTGNDFGTVNLTWAAPGDDGTTGTATSYFLRYSKSNIASQADFNNGFNYTNAWTPVAQGLTESKTVKGLEGDTLYYFAIEARDDGWNQATLSNVVSARTGGVVRHVVISEFSTSGPKPSDDGAGVDYVELYNPSGSTVDISGYKLWYKTATGISWVNVVSVPASTNLAAGKRYLLARTEPSTTAYRVPEDGPTPDVSSATWTTSDSPADAGGHWALTTSAVTQSADVVANAEDLVGWGTADSPEGGLAVSAKTQGTRQAMERRPFTVNTQDRGINNADFGIPTREWQPDALNAPTRPTGVALTTPVRFQINVSWTANTETNISGYNVWLATLTKVYNNAPPSNYVQYTKQNSTYVTTGSTVIAGLNDSKTYYVRVTAVNSANPNQESGFSSEASATTLPDDQAPSAITNLSATTGSGPGEIILSWTAPGDDGTFRGNATSYLVRYSTLTSITTQAAFDAGQAFTQSWTPLARQTTETRTVDGLTADATFYFAVEARDEVPNQGGLSNGASAIAAAEISRTIDGSAADWATVTPGVVNAAQVSSSEWFWRDKQGEQRTVGTDPGSNYDLVDFHMAANTNDLYFMARLKDITNIDLPLIAVSIDSDQSATDTALSDVVSSTATLLHGGEYLAPKPAHYGEYAMIVHSTAAAKTAIEIRADGSATWSAPAGYGAGVASMSATNDIVEWKVSRADLGLSGAKTIRVAVAVFENNVGLANTVDVTKNYATTDALDAMSIVRVSSGNGTGQYTNDPTLALGAMAEDFDDGGNATTGTLDFVAEMALPANGKFSDTEPGVVTQLTPVGLITTLTPTLTWTAPSDPDSGDFLTGYLVELATMSNFVQTATYRINVVTTLTSWTVPTNLTDGQNYFWSVRARDREGLVSKYTNVRNFRIDASIPGAITSLTGVAGTGAGEVALSWTAPGDNANTGQVSSYSVKHATWTSSDTTGWWDGTISTGGAITTYTNAWEPKASGVWESFTLTGLSTTTALYFAVRAKDLAGNLAPPPTTVIGPVTPKAAPASGASSSATDVLISEVQTIGSVANDEFIEFYNPTNSAINLAFQGTTTGYFLRKRNSAGAEAAINVNASMSTIPAKGFLLITGPSYNGAVTGDGTYTLTSALVPDGAVILRKGSTTGAEADKVGWGLQPAGGYEGTAFSNAATYQPPADGSIERKPGASDATGGNGTDTGDNSADFAERAAASSDPQNSSSATEGGGSPQYTVGVYNVAPPYGNNGKIVPVLRVKVANEKAPGDVAVEVATVSVTLSTGPLAIPTTMCQEMFDSAALYLDNPTTGVQGIYEAIWDSATVGSIANADFATASIYNSSTGKLTFNQANGKLNSPDVDANLSVSAAPSNALNYFFVLKVSTWRASVSTHTFSAWADGDADVGLRKPDNTAEAASQINSTNPVVASTVTLLSPQTTTWAYSTGSLIYSPPRINVLNSLLPSTWDTIYVGADNGKLYAIYATGASQGTLKWTYTTVNSDRIRVEPIASSESGSTYIYFSDDGGNLYKIKDNGTAPSDLASDGGWRINLGGRVRSTPQRVTPSGDTQAYLYMGGGDSRVYKVDPSSGGIAAVSQTMPGAFTGSPSFDPDSSVLFIGAADKGMYRLLASDLTMATSAPMADAVTGSAFTRFDGGMTIMGAPDSSGTLYFKDTSNLNDSVSAVTTGGAIEASPYVTGRGTANSGYDVYVGNTAGVLLKINGAGSETWRTSTAGKLGTAGPIRSLPIPYPGIDPTYVYFGADDGGIYQVKAADGTRDTAKSWPAFVEGQVRAILLTTWDSRLYATSTDGRVYAFSIP